MASRHDQFIAETVRAGAVNKDGTEAAIELVAGDERLWVNLPVRHLRALAMLATELESLAHDAKNGVTGNWHLSAED